MVTTGIIRHVIFFILYILAQVWFFRNLILFDKAFCLMYVGFLLLLPIEAGTLLLMVVGFLTGLIIDTFYDTLGIHAAASVLIMYVRQKWLNLLTPQGGYDSGAVPDVYLQDIQWFTLYALPLIFVHHSIIFFIEAAGLGLFGFTLWKAILSSLYSFFVIVVIQYLFYKKRRS
jgi:hypothetical protein